MKLIINIPDDVYTRLFDNGIQDNEIAVNDVCKMARALRLGTPLDNNSERAEVQAYFDGQAYGWEQGRKALIDDVKAEIDKLPLVLLAGNYHIDKADTMDILENIGKESEDT